MQNARAAAVSLDGRSLRSSVAREEHGGSPLHSLRGVSRSFRLKSGHEQLVLDAIDFDVAEGEFITILGASGSGKSTLLRIMTGLLPVTSGEVRVRGDLLQGVMPNFGMVFQNPVLLPWRTALDNVLLPVEITGGRTADYRDRAIELLELMGLSNAVAKKPAQLSGGMRQRVAICRALIHDPQMLFMDEPFSALDELTRESLCDYLLKIWSQSGKTVVFVTHSVTEAIYLSDRVIVLEPEPGRICATLEPGLSRPRSEETRFDQVFLDAVREVQGLLREKGADR
jgi:NitT/TauT family transport system ATP-binding protein